MLAKDLAAYNRKLEILAMHTRGLSVREIARVKGLSYRYAWVVVEGGRSDAEVALASRRRMTSPNAA